MPLFGAHMSIAGGLHKAVETAAAHGMDTVQIFTHSPSQWAVKPVVPAGKEPLRDGKSLTKNNNQWHAKDLAQADIHPFKTAVRRARLRYTTAHDCYLINLASPDPALYRKSLAAFVVEMQRAEALGLHYLVTHPGAAVDGDEEAGLQRVAAALDEAHACCPGFRVKVLLETTAGQGTSLGHRFEHLARILAKVKEPARLGVCLDTCHVFAAGYALAPEKEYRATMREFNRLIGVRRLRLFHVNDSAKPPGSRVDRHAHIGKGCIGLDGFRLLVNDPRFRSRPMILETPKESADRDDMDAVNLRMLRRLVVEQRGTRAEK
ncbi:MAG: deoxyribonuclease IV [Planctomycetes bacterium]|nr:deoxyribonuclease IV [Planctomycetota bacterium]